MVARSLSSSSPISTSSSSILFNLLLVTLVFFTTPTCAQFQFFDNFFNQGQQQHHQHGQQGGRAKQNVASDSAWYRQNWGQATCSNYLCPDTLACVSVPHHCPCAFPLVEDKVELGSGSALCASKGGFKSGETARKIELARKGLL